MLIALSLALAAACYVAWNFAQLHAEAEEDLTDCLRLLGADV